MNILMHMCCSNCSIHPLASFLLEGVDVIGFWYNPNIHPVTEYRNRLDSVQRLSRLWNFSVEYIDEYPLDDFLKAVVGTGPDRCSVCYALRLEKTAAAARKMRCDGFSTSLLASPYQKFDIIIRAGREIGMRHGIPFVVRDFRKGWGLSRGLSRELGLYRQKYCGCIYSEMERFRNKEGTTGAER